MNEPRYSRWNKRVPDADATAAERMKTGKGADGSGGRGHKKNPVENLPQGSEPTKARDETLSRNLGLIGLYVRRHPAVVRNPNEFDDLFQAACLMFLERFGVYDGVHLSLFCRWMVQSAARDLRRRNRLSEAGALMKSQEPMAFDPPPDIDVAARVRDAVEQLPEPRRQLIVRRYGLDGQIPAILEDLRNGGTRQAVTSRLKTARRQLAEAIAGMADVF